MQSLGSATRPQAAVRREPALRRDPAPSRWQYKLQRLMADPALPRRGPLWRTAAVVVALVASLVFASADRRAAILASYEGLKQDFRGSPGVRVSLVSVTGAAPDLADWRCAPSWACGCRNRQL